jgi:hypothetical protein
VRTPTNPFEVHVSAEVHVPKEIIARMMQDRLDSTSGVNKGLNGDHSSDLVVWEGYPLKKDYTWEPIRSNRNQKLMTPRVSGVSAVISIFSFLARNTVT